MSADGADRGQRGRTRGQLILIGSLVIALAVIGLAVVANAVVFAESGHSRAGVEEIETGGDAVVEAERGAARVIAATNANRTYEDPDELNETVSGEVGNYSALFGESSADGTGAFAAVRYNDTADYGTRIVQDAQGDFTNESDNVNWTPVEDAAVGGFVVTINVSESDGSLWINGSLADSDLLIDATDDDSVELSGTAVVEPCTVDLAGGEDDVTVLVSEGRVAQAPDGCSFDVTDASVSQSITFDAESGTDLEGTYSLVVNESLDADPHFYDDETDEGPYLSEAVWTGEIEIEYETVRTSTRTDEREVDVYG